MNIQKEIEKLPFLLRIGIVAVIITVLCIVFFFRGKNAGTVIEEVVNNVIEENPAWNKPDYVSYEPIDKSEYSRPGTYLSKVNAVVVHYVANPGTSADENRSYFNGLKTSHTTYASSHFIIGLEGEVLQLMPLDEVAYCSNERNNDTVSIECCHPGEDGKFNDATYKSLITLLTDLCTEYKLDPMTEIIRHYDVTGKMCPKFYVENEDLWDQLKCDVAAEMTK